MKSVYVMLTYNGGTMPIDAIKSIDGVEGDVPIILVDNASRESYTSWLFEKLKPYGFKYVSGKDEKCHRCYLKLKRNRQWAGGNNEGIKLARKLGYDIAFLVNDDIIVKQPTLSHIEEYMSTHPDVGIVGPRVVHGDVKFREYSEQDFWHLLFHHLLGTKIKYLILRNIFRRKLIYDYEIDKPTEVSWVLGAAMAVKVDAIKKIGYIPVTGFFGYEEHIVSCLLKNQGYKTVYLPKGEIYHIGHQTLNVNISVYPILRYLKQCYGYSTVYLRLIHLVMKLNIRGLTLPGISRNIRRILST